MSDIVIIGAGVVGCAIARGLAITFPNKKIIVLEKNSGPGFETSNKNSNVLHSGLHQNPNFLKSKLVVRGQKLAINYITKARLPILDCGMIVAIPWKVNYGLLNEIGAFWNLMKRGQEQNIKFEFLGPRGLKKIEPNINAAGGIFIPNVWVTDAHAFTQSLKKDAEKVGVKFFFENPVEKIKILNNAFLGDAFLIKTSRSVFTAKTVINSAGLCADDIAKMAGYDYKIYPWRGEYYEVIGEKAQLVKKLIYPVVTHKSPGKGIHFSPRVDGKLFIGPNARIMPNKNYYEHDKTPVEVFLKAAQKFIPQIKREDLRWAYSGIRPKLTNKNEETDFIIRLERKNPDFINLIGIESPGLSAAMGIAEYVKNLLK